MRDRFLVAVISLFAISSPVVADGVSSRASRAGPVPLAYNWTGAYVGVHAGYGWAVPDLHLIPSGQVIPGPRPEGPLVGGQFGLNYQFGAWVVGAEAELSWANVEGSTNICSGTTLNCLGRPDSFASVAGRIGYSFDRLLLFAKAGLAWVHEEFEQRALPGGTRCVALCTTDATHHGWVYGGGVEYAFASNWSAKIEYNHFDLMRHDIQVTNGVDINAARIKADIDTVRFGLNFKFNWN